MLVWCTHRIGNRNKLLVIAVTLADAIGAQGSEHCCVRHGNRDWNHKTWDVLTGWATGQTARFCCDRLQQRSTKTQTGCSPHWSLFPTTADGRFKTWNTWVDGRFKIWNTGMIWRTVASERSTGKGGQAGLSGGLAPLNQRTAFAGHSFNS